MVSGSCGLKKTMWVAPSACTPARLLGLPIAPPGRASETSAVIGSATVHVMGESLSTYEGSKIGLLYGTLRARGKLS